MRDFDSYKPKPGYENAPCITAAQMDRFLHCGLGVNYAKIVAKAINASQRASVHEAGIDFSTDAPKEPVKPAEPKYLPIKRKVRPHDLEVGCVLRYCGNRPGTNNSGPCDGELKLGAEHRVTGIRGTLVFLDIPGWGSAEWTATGLSDWEFVSNPNYVHGFRIGETVYSTGGLLGNWGASSGFGPYTVKAAIAPGETYDGLPYEVLMECGSEFPASLLTRDPTKAYGYKAPVKYESVDYREVKPGMVLRHNTPDNDLWQQKDVWVAQEGSNSYAINYMNPVTGELRRGYGTAGWRIAEFPHVPAEY